MFTLLHASADYVDDDGSHRAQCIPGASEWSRRVAVDGSRFSPWFGRVLLEGRSLFGGAAFEVHVDNSRARLYSPDFNPREMRRRMADLLQEAFAVCDAMDGEAEGVEIAYQLKDCPPYANKKGIARFLATASGARVPEIFKNDRGYCCVVERTPPLRPESTAYRARLELHEDRLHHEVRHRCYIGRLHSRISDYPLKSASMHLYATQRLPPGSPLLQRKLC